MKIANIPLDRRLIKINGREVEITLSAELDQDNDLEALAQTIDFGDLEENAAYLAKFENGDLINVQITATAKLELTSESGFISGEDTLPGCHLKPYDYEDPESHEVKVRVIELLEFNGIMDSAIERLGENIRATLSKMGVDEIDIAV